MTSAAPPAGAGSPVRDSDLSGEALHARLSATWATPRGLVGRLSSVDHKVIAGRFIVTALVFLAIGGLGAVLMRLQLAQPEAGLIGPRAYNQIFTMHGTTMMFLFAVPIMEAFGLYLVPLMVGSRSIAFPRLNAFAYWLFLFGGLMIWIGAALGRAPRNGWFSYTPLAESQFSPDKGADLWAQMITFTEVSTLAVSVSLIVTMFKQRAPGMSIDRMPLFCWAELVTAFMVVFAMPAVMIATSMLIMDRLIGTHFFDTAAGGDSVLWQHLFWFFGHPEVYIIFVPALGMVSSIVATFARRPVFGHLPMVLSLVATGFLAFGLWVHHMFATGLPRLGSSFFTASSMLIAIPSGVQIFCWIATLWGGGRLRLATPLLFVIGFIVTFVIGGMTGIMVASVPLDLQVHDTFFVVAHFHYVLIGGAVFPLIGAIYYWFPKFTGRMMDERLGRWNFALAFIGFHLAFFPMHILGLEGMPRRIYTYRPEMGWGDLNLLSTGGAAILFVSFALLFWNCLRSWRGGVFAGPDPWGGGTLEWATTSPPPPYNFARTPVVNGLEPMWEGGAERQVATGLRVDMREVLISSVTDARPDIRQASPEPSIWPLISAIAVTILFIGSIYTPWAVVWGSIPLAIALTAWFWPKGTPEDES